MVKLVLNLIFAVSCTNSNEKTSRTADKVKFTIGTGDKYSTEPNLYLKQVKDPSVISNTFKSYSSTNCNDSRSDSMNASKKNKTF